MTSSSFFVRKNKLKILIILVITR